MRSEPRYSVRSTRNEKSVTSVAFDHLLGQEILGPKAEMSAVPGDQVHRRRADKGGDEAVGGVVIDRRRGADLADLAVIDHRDAVAHAHRLDLVVGDVDRRGADPLLELP